MENLEKRMYSLNLYNISPIQAAIQSLHSCMEYALKYWGDESFQDWAKNNKTVILLNGGTSVTMVEYFNFLEKHKIKCAAFYEPDLNMSLTSISFILDSNVFGKENVPLFIDSFFRKFKYDEFEVMLSNMHLLNEIEKEEFVEYRSRIGDTNLFLKFFTSKFSLSNN